MKSGWEIKPLGWVVLIALIGAVIYFLLYRKKPKQDQSE